MGEQPDRYHGLYRSDKLMGVVAILMFAFFLGLIMFGAHKFSSLSPEVAARMGRPYPIQRSSE